MKPRPTRQVPADTFDAVRAVGLALPDVEAATKYDGSPVLKMRGCFMAGLATHRSAEPATLVVRAAYDEREWLVQDAPETYYLTDYYQKHPVVLVRLSRIDHDALRDLLSVSWRLTAAKAGGPRGRRAWTAGRIAANSWRWIGHATGATRMRTSSYRENGQGRALSLAVG